MPAKPFDPCDSFNFITNRISRLIGQIIENKGPLHQMNFPPSCLEVLGELWHQDAINQKDLGKALIKTKSSINKMIIALENAEMIYRQEDTQDRRNKIVLLTEKGRNFKEFMLQKSQEGERRATEGISEQDVQKTKEVLKKMYNNLQNMYEQGLTIQSHQNQKQKGVFRT